MSKSILAKHLGGRYRSDRLMGFMKPNSRGICSSMAMYALCPPGELYELVRYRWWTFADWVAQHIRGTLKGNAQGVAYLLRRCPNKEKGFATL
jgi:hypothetical protein